MGFVERRPALGRQVMTAGDYIRLAVLGAASRTPVSVDDAVRAVADLSGPFWTPVAQLVFDAIDDMLEAGLLNPVDRSSRLALSGDGTRLLHELITLPVASPLTTFGQVGIRLKLAFLDLAAPAMRRRQVEGILRACECEIASRGAACPAWRLNGPLGRLWLDHQMEALEETVEVLRRLARAEGTNQTED